MLLWLQLDVPQAAHPHQATSCETPPSEGCASKSYFKMVEKILEILERNRSRKILCTAISMVHTHIRWMPQPWRCSMSGWMGP